MSELSKTNRLIEKLENQSRICRRENAVLSSVIKNMKKKKHFHEVLEAGRIFEELGILDRYDKEKVIQLLKDNMEHILIKHEE
ncbi:hypothetical protein [Anaerovibrio sp.]|uniref:hypothetical protein n=1 Tax=Anaerovibrio sp. TaxID=1872532 RepID=UPI00388DCFA2